MKNSKIEKQLKKQLADSTPSNFEEILEQCPPKQPILNAEPVVTTQLTSDIEENIAIKHGGNSAGFSIVAWALAAVFFCLIVLMTLFQSGVFFGDASLQIKKGSFLFDVNPSVEVFYNGDGNVTEMKGLNEDGKALIMGISLLGKRYDEVADILFDRCVRMGYIASDRENNALMVTAVSDNGEKDTAVTSVLKQSLIKEFSDNKMRGVVITGVTSPVLTEQAKKYGIDAQKYGLILQYQANGGVLAEDKYATISIRELYTLLESQELEFKRLKTEETKIVLEKFENDLQETLAEQIDILLSTLDVFMPLEEEMGASEKFDVLQGYAAELEQVTTGKERKVLINKILAELDSLKKKEQDVYVVELIECAKVSISVTYNFFENAFNRLLKISASPKEISRIRLYKFAMYGQKEVSCNFAAWQKEREKVFAENWYATKADWKIERAKDISCNFR